MVAGWFRWLSARFRFYSYVCWVGVVLCSGVTFVVWGFAGVVLLVLFDFSGFVGLSDYVVLVALVV